MRTRLRVALTDAMKARDRVAVAALRSALSAIENAEAIDASDAPTAVEQPAGTTDPPADTDGAGHPGFAGSVAGLRAAEVERRVLTDAEVERIVRAEATDRLAAADEYERSGRHDHAERLRGEAAVLHRYLP